MNKNLKIYISEKEKGFDISEPVAINDCFYANSLEQHEEEIRKQEREYVIDRLLEYLNKEQDELSDEGDDWYVSNKFYEFEQKLKEMKGDKQ